MELKLGNYGGNQAVMYGIYYHNLVTVQYNVHFKLVWNCQIKYPTTEWIIMHSDDE